MADWGAYYDDAYDGPPTSGPLRQQKLWLGIDLNYCRSWKAVDGIREFFQNCEDGMRASFQINPRTHRLCWDRSDTATEIRMAAVLRSKDANGTGPGLQVGYILYSKKKNTLDIANVDAKLLLEHLGIGYTSKHNAPTQAGVHGEGFKVGAVVLLRGGHRVTMHSNGAHWAFNYDENKRNSTFCQINPSKAKKITRPSSACEVTGLESCTFVVNVYEDTSVTIAGVSEALFGKLVDGGLNLRPPAPEEVVSSRDGELILDRSFLGQIFLKGLRIEGWQPRNQPHDFGYNYSLLNTDRDRRQTDSAKEEAGTVIRMLAHAFQSRCDAIKDRITDLWFNQKNCADIQMMEEYMPVELAHGILAHGKVRYPQSFFYPGDQGASEGSYEHTIATVLHKVPLALPQALWNALRRHSVLRTPDAEMLHRFESSKGVQPPSTAFGLSVVRGVRACLALHPRLSAVPVRSVDGGNTGIDVLFGGNQNTFLIHVACLNFSQAHQNAPCSLSATEEEHDALDETPHFSCTHIVENVLRRSLRSFINAKNDLISQAEEKELQASIPVRLIQMPQNVQVLAQAGSVEVSWASNESAVVQERCAKQTSHEVWLHDEDLCELHKDSLLMSNAALMTTDCACPRQTVPEGRRTARFDGLDPVKSYFALVARTGEDSIFSLPSEPVSPLPMSSAPATSQGASRAPANCTRVSLEPAAEDVSVHSTTAERADLSNASDSASTSSDVDMGSDSEYQGTHSPPGRPAVPATIRPEPRTPRTPRYQQSTDTASPAVLPPRTQSSPNRSASLLSLTNISSAYIDLDGRESITISEPRIGLRANRTNDGMELIVKGASSTTPGSGNADGARAKKRRRY